MKKILLTLTAAAAWLGAAAQLQLENPGFEGDWKSIEPYTGGATTTVGTTPDGWCVANVAGYRLIWWFGSTQVASRVEGYGGGWACRLENAEASGNVIPGYVTLGTAWNTANTSGGNADGGSFGGRTFTGRPDAMEFWYRRSARDNSQPASVVAYLWTGGTSQADVPVSIGGSPTRVTMQDRDRNVLGMSYSLGGEVSRIGDFRLVASLMAEGEHAVKLTQTAEDWTRAELEFTYHDGEARPEHINVVFSAADYFADRTNHRTGNTLTVDAVRFIYRSGLAEALYDGAELSFEDEAASVAALYEPEKLSLRSDGRGASVRTDYDEEAALLTVTVSGEDIGENPDNYHTYTIQFEQPAVHSTRLSDLRVGGATLEGFDPDVADYAYAGLYEEGIAEVTAEDGTAETAFSYDPQTGLLTITVQAGEEERAYTVQFDLPAEADPYDLNEDGSVDVADVTMLVNHILNSEAEAPELRYDLNGDGSVDVADVTMLVNHILTN